MKAWRHVIAMGLLLVCSVVFAASPTELIQTTADRVVHALNKGRGNLSNSRIHGIIRQNLLPKVDVNAMSRSVLGRRIWNSASGSQRSRFKNEFVSLVINTYSSALRQYTNEKVKVYPLRGDAANRSRVLVRSKIIRKNGPSIPLNYRLVRRGSGWRIYDMSVEGVSMVQSFRSQFAGELSRGSLEQLIQRLSQHNRGRR